VEVRAAADFCLSLYATSAERRARYSCRRGGEAGRFPFHAADLAAYGPKVDLATALDDSVCPLVEDLRSTLDTAGLGLAVVGGEEVVARGFGVRDVRSAEPVTAETMFHLASVSKPFVATAVLTLATRGELDLDAPPTDHVPELSLADGRADEVTARGLLSHSSGLGDVSDYGWHDPQLGDDALREFARSLSGRRLEHEPGTFHYSNAAYELLGLLVSRVAGATFEDAMTRLVLAPAGMTRSTFLRGDVPAELAASPHVGAPLVVPGDAYPYTRRHAPSSTLHSNLEEMCGWMRTYLDATLDPAVLGLLTDAVVAVDDAPWDESVSLGWALGTWGGERVLSHSGMDPGFRSLVALVPERRTGVVLLANSNTVPGYALVGATLDAVLGTGDAGAAGELRALLRPIAGPVAAVLTSDGAEAAAAAYHRLLAADPPEVDVEDDGFEDAVWGAIELHRADLVWPLLRLWTDLQPDSSAAWTMTGWAHQVDGEISLAGECLRRALELDPDNEDAALILAGVPG